MLRAINTLLVFVLIALVVMLHQLKFESRQLQKQVSDVRDKVQKEQEAISVLRAELSLLTSPERIERLAKKHLDLQTVKPEQIVPMEWLSKQKRVIRRVEIDVKKRNGPRRQ